MLLLLLLVLCVTLAALTNKWRKEAALRRAEQLAIEHLLTRDAAIGYEFMVDAQEYTYAEPGAPPSAAKYTWLERLLGEDWPRVKSVHFQGQSLHAHDIAHLTHFRRLNWLCSHSGEFDEGALTTLEGLTSLEHLYLHSTKLPGSSIEPLRELTNLRVVTVSE